MEKAGWTLAPTCTSPALHHQTCLHCTALHLPVCLSACLPVGAPSSVAYPHQSKQATPLSPAGLLLPACLERCRCQPSNNHYQQQQHCDQTLRDGAPCMIERRHTANNFTRSTLEPLLLPFSALRTLGRFHIPLRLATFPPIIAGVVSMTMMTCRPQPSNRQHRRVLLTSCATVLSPRWNDHCRVSLTCTA